MLQSKTKILVYLTTLWLGLFPSTQWLFAPKKGTSKALVIPHNSNQDFQTHTFTMNTPSRIGVITPCLPMIFSEDPNLTSINRAIINGLNILLNNNLDYNTKITLYYNCYCHTVYAEMEQFIEHNRFLWGLELIKLIKPEKPCRFDETQFYQSVAQLLGLWNWFYFYFVIVPQAALEHQVHLDDSIINSKLAFDRLHLLIQYSMLSLQKTFDESLGEKDAGPAVTLIAKKFKDRQALKAKTAFNNNPEIDISLNLFYKIVHEQFEAILKMANKQFAYDLNTNKTIMLKFLNIPADNEMLSEVNMELEYLTTHSSPIKTNINHQKMLDFSNNLKNGICQTMANISQKPVFQWSSNDIESNMVLLFSTLQQPIEEHQPIAVHKIHTAITSIAKNLQSEIEQAAEQLNLDDKTSVRTKQLQLAHLWIHKIGITQAILSFIELYCAALQNNHLEIGASQYFSELALTHLQLLLEIQYLADLIKNNVWCNWRDKTRDADVIIHKANIIAELYQKQTGITKQLSNQGFCIDAKNLATLFTNIYFCALNPIIGWLASTYLCASLYQREDLNQACMHAIKNLLPSYVTPLRKLQAKFEGQVLDKTLPQTLERQLITEALAKNFFVTEQAANLSSLLAYNPDLRPPSKNNNPCNIDDAIFEFNINDLVMQHCCATLKVEGIFLNRLDQNPPIFCLNPITSQETNLLLLEETLHRKQIHEQYGLFAQSLNPINFLKKCESEERAKIKQDFTAQQASYIENLKTIRNCQQHDLLAHAENAERSLLWQDFLKFQDLLMLQSADCARSINFQTQASHQALETLLQEEAKNRTSIANDYNELAELIATMQEEKHLLLQTLTKQQTEQFNTLQTKIKKQIQEKRALIATKKRKLAAKRQHILRIKKQLKQTQAALKTLAHQRGLELQQMKERKKLSAQMCSKALQTLLQEEEAARISIIDDTNAFFQNLKHKHKTRVRYLFTQIHGPCPL